MSTQANITVGSNAPDFTAATDGGGSLTLSSLRGKRVILYFYPKDDTPGCTTEACGFRDAFPRFEGLDAVILGVSKDSPKRHDGFKKKYGLPFTLVSDESGAICEAYGVWVEKSMYGKTSMGIRRSTFVIDATGHVTHVWPSEGKKLDTKTHADDVYSALAAG